LDTFQEGAPLSSGGWTNLCPAATQADIHFVNQKNATTEIAGADAAIPKVSNLPPGARDIVKQGARVLSMTAVLDDDAPGGSEPTPKQQRAVREEVNRAMKDGASEGTLQPDRLLAEAQLLPRMGSLDGLTPSAESAIRLAGAAHAYWTVIYTMRKSPVRRVAFRLAHAPVPEPADEEPQLDPPIVLDLEAMASNRFEFTREEVAAHNQAAQSWQNQPSEKGAQ
jgi:hypothetical protein